MPAHDWTKVEDGIFHDFQLSWMVVLKKVLNSSILPKGFYALSEQITIDVAPEIIALPIIAPGAPSGRQEHLLSAAVMPPPRATIVHKFRRPTYPNMRRTIVIRDSSDHSVVALIEILSHGNKARKKELDAFLNKAQAALEQSIHLLIVDLYPLGRLDPLGIHGALMTALAEEPAPLPAGKPLVVASYEAKEEVAAYVEPFGVGDPIPDAVLYLREGFYVRVPLEETYRQAFESMPEFWRQKLET